MVGRTIVTEVGEGMSERRKLPIEYREHARFGGVIQQIFEPVVPMRDRRRVVGWYVRRQPSRKLAHRRKVVGLRRFVLLLPARELPRHVVAGLAEILEPSPAN